jgi:predicted CoA-binding protein
VNVGGIINDGATSRAREAGCLVVTDRCMPKEPQQLKKRLNI